MERQFSVSYRGRGCSTGSEGNTLGSSCEHPLIDKLVDVKNKHCSSSNQFFIREANVSFTSGVFFCGFFFNYFNAQLKLLKLLWILKPITNSLSQKVEAKQVNKLKIIVNYLFTQTALINAFS